MYITRHLRQATTLHPSREFKVQDRTQLDTRILNSKTVFKKFEKVYDELTSSSSDYKQLASPTLTPTEKLLAESRDYSNLPVINEKQSNIIVPEAENRLSKEKFNAMEKYFKENKVGWYDPEYVNRHKVAPRFDQMPTLETEKYEEAPFHVPGYNYYLDTTTRKIETSHGVRAMERFPKHAMPWGFRNHYFRVLRYYFGHVRGIKVQPLRRVDKVLYYDQQPIRIDPCEIYKKMRTVDNYLAEDASHEKAYLAVEEHHKYRRKAKTVIMFALFFVMQISFCLVLMKTVYAPDSEKKNTFQISPICPNFKNFA